MAKPTSSSASRSARKQEASASSVSQPHEILLKEQRRLRPLAPAPKSEPWPEQLPHRGSKRRAHSLCKVKLCIQPDCQLQSHRHFQSRRSRVQSSDSTNDAASHDLAVLNPQVVPNTNGKYNSLLLRREIDGFPALPLSGDATVYQELFHHFFHHQYDRIVHILMPPPVTSLQRRQYVEVKENALRMALSVPLFCLHHCAASHHQLVFRRDRQCPDEVTDMFQYKMMRLLRNKLKGVENGEVQQVDIILVILTLVMYETSTGNLTALAFHRRAMEHLVKSHGGVHNMGHYAAYVLLLDRILALYLDLPPALSSPPDRAIRRPFKYPQIYGSFFDALEQEPPQNLIEKAVGDYCFDVCRAIEMMEMEGLSLDPKAESDNDQPDSPVLHYFFFLKESIASSYVHLNAELACDEDRYRSSTRLLAFAGKIVDYTVLQGCYIVGIPLHVASKARKVILTQQRHIEDNADDVLQHWHEYETELKILVWACFTICSMPVVWEHQQWAMECLVSMLDIKYAATAASIRTDNHMTEITLASSANGMGVCSEIETQYDQPIPGWARNWKQLEHDNVREFVWSDSTFYKGFAATCSELDSLRSGQPGIL